MGPRGARRRGDGRGFVGPAVILPQPRERVAVALELGVEGEGLQVRVHGQRRRTGRVDADADDAFGPEAPSAPRLGEGALDRLLQTEQPVRRRLARDVVVLGVREDSVDARRIRAHVRADLPAGGHIDDEGANAVGAVIDPEGVMRCHVKPPVRACGAPAALPRRRRQGWMVVPREGRHQEDSRPGRARRSSVQ